MTDETNSKKSTRLEDLAEKAGVSISTVSRALNDSPAVNRRTKQQIWKLARELDYPFRGYMPAGPIGAKGTIAVVVPRPQARDTRLSDPFFFELLASIGTAARERSCDLLISHIAPNSLDELAYALDTNRADGVIFIGQSSLHSAFNELIDHESRFVVWGADIPEQLYCSIGSDNLLGGRRAASHLLKNGRSKLIFLGDQSAPEALLRFRGFLDAHNQAGITVPEERIVTAHFEVESAQSATASLVRSGIDFDGIVAASDLIALGAIKALRLAGKTVPDDVAIVGYDNIPVSRLSYPALTTVSQDTGVAGRMLVSKLLDSSDGAASSERTPTELIIRDTCGA